MKESTKLTLGLTATSMAVFCFLILISIKLVEIGINITTGLFYLIVIISSIIGLSLYFYLINEKGKKMKKIHPGKIEYIKNIWQDNQKALTFTNSNTLDDLVELFKLIHKRKELEILVSSIIMKDKTSEEINDLLERLKMLGEIYDPYLKLEKEGRYIKIL